MKEIKATVEGDNVVLILPVDILVYACEHNPNTRLRVPDKDCFAKWIADTIVWHDADEAGASALHRLLDSLFDSAAEHDVIEIG